jgi:hypothetical protein
MSHPRPTPFGLVFAPIAEERFPRIRDAMAAAGRPPTDRDGFLMEREAVLLLRELRPDEGLGEGMAELAALVHHAFVLWSAGLNTIEITPDQLTEVLDDAATPPELTDLPPPCYVQFPPHRVWAEVLPGQAHEPLDGCFMHASPSGDLMVLGVFGLHPERMGFSVVEAAGRRPAGLARADGSPLFAPTLPGGRAAGLYSHAGGAELLELGWRTAAGTLQWTR